jgi:hypothetical protein
VGEVRAGVRWCRLWQDVRAAREAGIPLLEWLPWAMSCEVKSAMALDDPFPLVGAALARGLARVRRPARDARREAAGKAALTT